MPEAETAEAHTEGTSNGVSSSFESDRAAFIAGITGEQAASDANGKADDSKAENGKADADEDSDLDDDTDADEADESEDEDESDEEDKSEQSADDDSDLDEEDDEDEKKVDGDTAKRLAQVKRTDKRLREQREKQFRAREAELDARESELKEARAEVAEFKSLISRMKNPYEVGDVLIELGLSEDDAEAASQALYARSKKYANDPKAREAITRAKGERELREEVSNLKKWREERETRDREAQESAAAQERGMKFLGDAAKLATEKTPLAATYLERSPERAYQRMAEITARLWDQTGEQPAAKKVIVELERDRRRELRDLGIDPKTRTAAAKATTDKPADKTKTAANGSKKPEKPSTSAKADDKKPLTKEDFIKGIFD